MLRHPLFTCLATITSMLILLVSTSSLANERSVRIGVYDNPPKIFINNQGEMSGFFGDLIKEIAAQENWTLTAIECDWNECLTLLQENELDLMPHNVVKTVIELGKSLDLNTIAEGVETAEQKTSLEQLGCHRFQGYFFSKPVPIEEFNKHFT